MHETDRSTAGYAADKEGWFTDYAAPRMEAWVQRTGWEPPSYPADERADDEETADGGAGDGGIDTVSGATGGAVSPGTAQS